MMNQTSSTTARSARAALVPLAALAGALLAAVVGALVTGSELSGLTATVEGASASSGNALGAVGDLFPLGFAFSAGMVSAVNPCGFAMLPAYIGLFLGEGDPSAAQGRPERLQRAVVVGLSVTLGFVLLFALVGLPIGLGARGIVSGFPWVGLGVGVALTAGGAYLLGGGKLYSSLGVRLSARMGGSERGVRGYVTFGVGYGLASLSCTLPVFLAVIGGTFTTSTALDSLLGFGLYGVGMGTVILFLTLGMALFKGIAARALRRLLPIVTPVSALLLLASGAFIVYYWLTIGGLLERLGAA
jgi:cytochrome c-type biogenesis protein